MSEFLDTALENMTEEEATEVMLAGDPFTDRSAARIAPECVSMTTSSKAVRKQKEEVHIREPRGQWRSSIRG